MKTNKQTNKQTHCARLIRLKKNFAFNAIVNWNKKLFKFHDKRSLIFMTKNHWISWLKIHWISWLKIHWTLWLKIYWNLLNFMIEDLLKFIDFHDWKLIEIYWTSLNFILKINRKTIMKHRKKCTHWTLCLKIYWDLLTLMFEDLLRFIELHWISC